MEVTALGHAGLAIRERRALVFVDPWFAPGGAFAASWFVYPDNVHLVEDLDTPAAVVISHEHADHLDPWFLARLPTEVPVIVPRYPSPILRRKLRDAGRSTITELPDGQRLEVAPHIGVRFVREESPMNHDAAVVIDTPTGNVVDLNDARLFPVQLRDVRSKLGGSVDVLALQCAGASWYPLVYDYPSARMDELRRAKRGAKLSYAFGAIGVADADHVLPIGGPPCFLDRELAYLNDEMDEGVFPDLRNVAGWLRGQGVDAVKVLLPGDSLSVPSGAVSYDPHWADFWEQDRDSYLATYATSRAEAIETELARYPEPDGDLAASFAEHAQHLVGLSPYFDERIDMRVGFDVTGPGGGQWHVDFRHERAPVGIGLQDCGYVYQFASRWLLPILAGRLSWEDFFLSLRFRARRDPDLYNDHLLGLLKFAHADALSAVEHHERSLDTTARTTIVAPDGRRWSVSRWCPHAGSDLREVGEVVDGDVLQCLAHHYRFDLHTGTCINSRCASLAVEPVGEIQVRLDGTVR